MMDVDSVDVQLQVCYSEGSPVAVKTSLSILSYR